MIDPQLLLKIWRTISNLPLGKKVFSKILGFLVPYSGTIHGTLDVVEPGRVEVILQDRRRVRNHLHSIHAIALANLGEMSTGLCMMVTLPKGCRAILKSFSIEYFKKSRGTIRAVCVLDSALVKQLVTDANGGIQKHEFVVVGDILDREKIKLAQVKATWLAGPI